MSETKVEENLISMQILTRHSCDGSRRWTNTAVSSHHEKMQISISPLAKKKFVNSKNFSFNRTNLWVGGRVNTFLIFSFFKKCDLNICKYYLRRSNFSSEFVFVCFILTNTQERDIEFCLGE